MVLCAAHLLPRALTPVTMLKIQEGASLGGLHDATRCPYLHQLESEIGCRRLIPLPLCRVDCWQLGGIIILVHSPVDAADISTNTSPASINNMEDATTEPRLESGLLERQHANAAGVLVRAKMEYQVIVDTLSVLPSSLLTLSKYMIAYKSTKAFELACFYMGWPATPSIAASTQSLQCRDISNCGCGELR